MRVDGHWLLCDDGVTRPVFRAEIRTADGAWVQTTFLADCAADRTVLSGDLFRELGLPALSTDLGLTGVGGSVDSVIVETRIQFQRAAGQPISISGRFAAFTETAAIDMSVLGRDITNHFAIIVDRPQDVVCMLGPGHRYAIFSD